jgi:hypothetical protein
MSTGLECDFIEVEPAKWYYVLEDGFAPKNAWDWREFARAYGPFPTEDTALEHLRKNHANPGGYNTAPYVEGFKPDETLAKLIAEAESRRFDNKRR